MTVSPKSGTRDSEITVTGTGFASDADATVELVKNNATSTPIGLGTAPVTDDSFSLVITAGSSFATGDANWINAVDGSGNKANSPDFPSTANPRRDAQFTINRGTAVSPDTISLAEALTITLTDRDDTYEVSMVEFGGTDAVLDNPVDIVSSPTKTEFKVNVPEDARTGKQTVKVTATKTDEDALTGTASVTIRPLALSVSPTTAVPCLLYTSDAADE